MQRVQVSRHESLVSATEFPNSPSPSAVCAVTGLASISTICARPSRSPFRQVVAPQSFDLAYRAWHSRIHAVPHGAGAPSDATPSRKRKASAEEPPRETVPPPAVAPPTSEEKRVASTLKARERRAKLKKEREEATVSTPVPLRQPAAPTSCGPARSVPGEWRRRSMCAASRQ